MSAFHSIYLLPFESALSDEVRNQIVMVFYNLLLESAVSLLPHLLYGVRLCITTGCVCVCVSGGVLGFWPQRYRPFFKGSSLKGMHTDLSPASKTGALLPPFQNCLNWSYSRKEPTALFRITPCLMKLSTAGMVNYSCPFCKHRLGIST